MVSFSLFVNVTKTLQKPLLGWSETRVRIALGNQTVVTTKDARHVTILTRHTARRFPGMNLWISLECKSLTDVRSEMRIVVEQQSGPLSWNETIAYSIT